MMRETGFHRADADYTKGRAQYIAEAEALARMQDGVTRKVILLPPNNPETDQ